MTMSRRTPVRFPIRNRINRPANGRRVLARGASAPFSMARPSFAQENRPHGETIIKSISCVKWRGGFDSRRLHQYSVRCSTSRTRNPRQLRLRGFFFARRQRHSRGKNNIPRFGDAGPATQAQDAMRAIRDSPAATSSPRPPGRGLFLWCAGQRTGKFPNPK